MVASRFGVTATTVAAPPVRSVPFVGETVSQSASNARLQPSERFWFVGE